MMQFIETLHPDFCQLFTVDKVLYRETTEHQDLVIFENAIFGRVLALDGVIQTTERDDHVYHEMLAHVPILAHGGVRDVLIVGGGDGGCLREVARHAVASITMVEIDRTVIELSKTYLPMLSAGAFADPRLDLVIADGNAFVHETERRFDVIIVDSTDPIGPGEILFSEEFYAGCKRCLATGGVLVTQNGVPMVQADEVRDSYQRLSRLFADTSFYLAAVPSYSGGAMTFGWATDDASLRDIDVATLRTRFDAAGFSGRYYTPEIHVAAFALPPDIMALMT
ncbi:MAG: polyamine aminopropyltransferase [Alphaproteobacteria bacterium]